MNNHRVVITGMGVLSSIGNDLHRFTQSLKEGKSGIQKIPILEELGFGCQVGGLINIASAPYYSYIEQFLLSEASNVVKYAVVAGLEAWTNAGLNIPENFDNEPDYSTGIITGSAIGTVDIYEHKILPNVHNKTLRRLRSTTVEHSMLSAPSANLAGILGLANYIGFNSSACSTGTESIILGYRHIKQGLAKRMLVGGVDIFTPAGWSGFDAMRVTNRNSNEHPELASRPMSASAQGFVPAEGCGMLVLEDYQTAINRGAPIIAEMVGGHINSGGQRKGGTMTAPSSEGVIRCIHEAIKEANIHFNDIDLISGHLSSTMADVLEIQNWRNALNREKESFPYINSLKSMTGHAIAATGAIETIATAIQLKDQFLHPSLNCEDLHPEIARFISEKKVPHQTKNNISLQYAIKSSFGFGDTNAVLILKKI
ncbi:MAG: beta-ketoacyl-[acyl-carrier-protein] synthase family protein [Bacteroidales bacterium]|nr:beta-ketoacyl-[acyl-carrier-protein] synthase family protein [Bacteroidales bacterium]